MVLPTGIYSSILQGLAGSLSTTQKTNLWHQFTTTNGLSSAPPEAAATEAQFVSFLINNSNIQTQALSPAEIERRQSLSTVITIILQLMKSVQETDVVQNALLLFYSKYQNQYTQMNAAVPIDLGGQNPTFSMNAANPSQTIFGYNNISVTDISNYLVADPSGSGFTFTTSPQSFYQANTNSSGTISWTISFTPSENGQGSVKLSLNYVSGFPASPPLVVFDAPVSVNPSAPVTQQVQTWTSAIMNFLQANTTTTTLAKVITVPSADFYNGTLSEADRNYLYNFNYVHTGGASNLAQALSTNDVFTVPVPPPAGLSTALTNILNATPSITFNVPGNQQFAPKSFLYAGFPQQPPSNASISWRYTTQNVPGQYNDGGDSSADENFARTNAIVQQRASENQKLQQFIQSIKAQSSTMQSNLDGVNNNIQSSNATLKGQVSLITSTLQTLQAILQGIFS